MAGRREAVERMAHPLVDHLVHRKQTPEAVQLVGGRQFPVD
jgi:hypothetical protein